MDVKKSIQLTTAPLEELMAKGESIDFRLDEAAWQDLGVEDYIEFREDFTGGQTKPADESRRVIVHIEEMVADPIPIRLEGV